MRLSAPSGKPLVFSNLLSDMYFWTMYQRGVPLSQCFSAQMKSSYPWAVDSPGELPYHQIPLPVPATMRRKFSTDTQIKVFFPRYTGLVCCMMWEDIAAAYGALFVRRKP